MILQLIMLYNKVGIYHASYILVYIYLDFHTTRLKVTKTESTVLGILFFLRTMKHINVVTNSDVLSTMGSRMISIAGY